MRYFKLLAVLTVFSSCKKQSEEGDVKQNNPYHYGEAANVFFKCNAEYLNEFTRDGQPVTEKWTYQVTKYFNNTIKTISMKVKKDGNDQFETKEFDLRWLKDDTWAHNDAIVASIFQDGDAKGFKVEHKTMGWETEIGGCTSVVIESVKKKKNKAQGQTNKD